MNWSHALLVVSLVCGVASMPVAIVYANAYRATIFHRNWVIALFITATISGALAAGLWR